MPTTRSSATVDPAAAAAAAAHAASLVPPNPGPGTSAGTSGTSGGSTTTTRKGGRKKKTGGAAPPAAAPPAASPPAQNQQNQGQGQSQGQGQNQGQSQQGQGQAQGQQQAGQSYDPAEPTEDEGIAANQLPELAADLKDFLGEHLADVRDELKRDLLSETKRLQRLFNEKVAEEVEYTKKQILAESSPTFKHDYNNIHWKRAQSSLVFIIDARKALKEKNFEEADIHLAAHEEAIKEHLKHIKWADASPVCWELIKRLEFSAKDKEIKQIEAEIVKEREEKKNAGRKRQRRDSSPEVQEVGRKSGGGNSSTASGSKRFEQNGPCIWCSKHGHHYRFCDLWKADVDNGAAKFNTTTRKWERVDKGDASAKKN